MVRAALAAARRGATVFIHDDDTPETRRLHGKCSEILSVNLERKIGKKRVIVTEALFIYRPVAVAQVVAESKIEVALAANTFLLSAAPTSSAISTSRNWP